MPQLKAAAYVFLVLIDFDSIAFHWLHRAEGIMAVWSSYQRVYERDRCNYSYVFSPHADKICLKSETYSIKR